MLSLVSEFLKCSQNDTFCQSVLNNDRKRMFGYLTYKKARVLTLKLKEHAFYADLSFKTTKD